MLNQYERWDRPGSPGVLARQRYTYDDDGNLVQTWVAGDMNCDGLVNAADINLFQAAILMGKTWWETTYPNCPYLNGDINGDGLVDFGDINPFTSLVTAGNATVAQTFVWDGENRLIEVRPTAPVSGDKMVEFKYDYLGRRVQKCVLVWDPTLNNGAGGWSDSPGLGAYARRFVWSGWLMLLELEGSVGGPPASESIVRKYTWGLDLAGLSGGGGFSAGGGSLNGGGPASSRSLEGAGGISGLLAMQAPGAGPGGGNLDVVYTYDANGNVGQLVAWATGFGGAEGDEWHLDRLVAHYEYDPYGGVMAQSGTYADDNPVRFSTKYWDDETGLGYWGYRYYSPSLGRWISRDPIEELGGPNVYAFVGNGGLNTVDPMGLTYYLNPAVQVGQPRSYWCPTVWYERGNLPSRLREQAFPAWFVYYLIRGLHMGPVEDLDTFRLSPGSGAHIFKSGDTFQTELNTMAGEALNEARRQPCNTTRRFEKVYQGNMVIMSYLDPFKYIVQQFSWRGFFKCELSHLCWCCQVGGCGFEVAASCELDLHGWDRYDFHGRLNPARLLGHSFWLEWTYNVGLHTCRGQSCGDGTRRPGRTGSW